MEQWIASLPDRGQTPMQFLDGRSIVAEQLLKDPDMMKAFEQAYLSGCLRNYVIRDTKPPSEDSTETPK
jgi:hypothetical protein